MIVHRMVESLRTRHFSTLVIELLVVIIGVFIGIQVSNWNEARLERTRAHSYLERIGADLDADILNYEDRLRFWEDVLEYGAVGLDFAETSARDDRTDWGLLLAYFQASQLAEFYTTQATYDELKSGGELGLIRDLTLRNQLARYYTNANNPVLTERPRYREHVRGLIPLGVQDYIWNNCYSSDGETRQELLDCDGPIEPEKAGQIVQRIRGDEQLMSELRYWMSTMRVALLIGNERLSFAKRVRDLVERQVEGK